MALLQRLPFVRVTMFTRCKKKKNGSGWDHSTVHDEIVIFYPQSAWSIYFKQEFPLLYPCSPPPVLPMSRFKAKITKFFYFKEI